MKTKIYIIIMAAMLLGSRSYSQQNDFVSLDGKKFMYNCQEFYPKVMNFHIGTDALSGERFVTPYSSYRKDNCGYLSYTQTEGRNMLKAQFQMVKDLGFNCIRLCGIGVYADSKTGPLMIHYNSFDNHIPNETLNDVNYNKAFLLLESVFEIAKEVDLKVIFLVGGRYAEYNIEQYCDFLRKAAQRFANQPALLAYDLYNEPAYWGTSNLTKSLVFNATWKWYRAIRDNTPNQLVTIGIGTITESLYWDPAAIPLDFLSFHFYSYKDIIFKDAAPYFKWIGANVSKPWIIGETGFPADTQSYPYLHYRYINIAQYADTIKRLNAINGSSGFSWWIYQDLCWGGTNLPGVTEDFFGLMNRYGSTETSDTSLIAVDGTRKIDSVTFVNYNPGYNSPTATEPWNYHNIWQYTSTACTGSVDGPNGPIKDAVIQGWKAISPMPWKGGAEPYPVTIYPSFITFTNDTGYYALKTDYPYNKLCALYIGYPGDSTIGDWFKVPAKFDTALISLNFNFGSGINEFNDYIIKSGDTIVWEYPMMMAGNLVIKNGGQLTVKNTVFFNTDRKVTIDHGGKMIVDGGKLTSGCEGSKWTGVEILGDPNQAQTQQYQGYIELRDSAVIENAETGLHCVLNAFTPTGEEYTSHESGGIIDADSAFFINNHIAINIEHYFPGSENVYNSYIKNCTFEYPNEIIAEIQVIYIKLSGVEGVNIFANKFEGNTDNELTTRGIGIDALDATFKLNNIYEPPNPNVFNNLAYGIRCCNTCGLFNPEISLTTFTDCWRAIYMSGVVDAKVLGDTISYKSQSSTNEAYGIYLDNCDGYQVEGNVLSLSDNDGNKPEFGIIINNSGSEANQIYRNTFEKIEIPLNAQNVNREYYGNTGLQLLCNNIINCTVNDIIVTYEEADTCNGIRQDQGDYMSQTKIPAGNLFTYGDGNYLNYTNSSPHIVYYAHYDTASVIYYNGIPHYVKPKINIWSPISNQNTFIPWSQNQWEGIDCQNYTGLSGGGKNREGVEVLKEQIRLLQPKIDSAIAALKLKMDNGNTSALINRIKNCPVNGYGELYSDLRKYSPYISEKALLALINKQGFQINLLVNLMLINTHVAKTYWLMDALKLVQPPLTTSQYNQIKDKYKEFSEMELERMIIAGLVYQRDNAYNMIESYYAHDTLPKANDSLIRILKQDPRITSKYNLVNQYLTLKDTVKANEMLENIRATYSFDANGKQDYEKYQLLFVIKKQLMKEGRNFNSMTEQQQQVLVNSINKPSLSFSEMNSLNALRQVKTLPVGKMGNGKGKSPLISYEEPILKPIENIEKDLDNNEETKPEVLIIESLMDKVLLEQFNLVLYPNPANEEVNILYNAGINAGKLSIELSDVTGRIVGNYSVDLKNNIITIKTHNYKKGIYYVILIADGSRMKVENL